MAEVLVVANETLGGRKLIDVVRARAQRAQQAGEEMSWRLVVPQTWPDRGAIVYAEAVRDAAQVRVDLARQFMAEEGLDVHGEVGDPDPFTAVMDAVGEHQPDEIVVSTRPLTTSGWLRRDLVERIRQATGLPVEHVVSDVESEGLPVPETLVVANKTAGGAELLEHLKAKAKDAERHLFIVVVPLEDSERSGGAADRAARERLNAMLAEMREAGIVCAGMIGDPDPFTAVMNTVQSFHATDVVISTHPATRSGWMRGDLIERVRKATGLPVEHVVVEKVPEGAQA